MAKVKKFMKESNERVRGAFMKISAKKKGSTILKRTASLSVGDQLPHCEKEDILILVFQPEVVEEPQQKRKHLIERLHRKEEINLELD